MSFWHERESVSRGVAYLFRFDRFVIVAIFYFICGVPPPAGCMFRACIDGVEWEGRALGFADEAVRV